MKTYIKNILKHEIVNNIRTLKIEKLYGFFLDKNYNICDTIELSKGNKNAVFLDQEKFIFIEKKYTELNSINFVIMHNHPPISILKALVYPSEKDIIATYKIAQYCIKNNINLLDHIIVSKESYFSFAENDLFK